jgi:hypothetical protein
MTDERPPPEPVPPQQPAPAAPTQPLPPPEPTQVAPAATPDPTLAVPATPASDPAGPPPPAYVPPAAAAMPPPGPPSKRPMGLWIGLGAAFVAIAVLAFLLLTRDDKPDPLATSRPTTPAAGPSVEPPEDTPTGDTDTDDPYQSGDATMSADGETFSLPLDRESTYADGTKTYITWGDIESDAVVLDFDTPLTSGPQGEGRIWAIYVGGQAYFPGEGCEIFFEELPPPGVAGAFDCTMDFSGGEVEASVSFFAA